MPQLCSQLQQAWIISAYLLVTTSAALVVTDLGIVVSLAGAVAATTVIFIAPGACYLSLHPIPRWSRRRILAVALFASGCLLLPLLVTLVLAANGYLGEAWATE